MPFMLYAFQHNNKREGTHKYMYSSGLNREAECETRKEIDTVLLHLLSKANKIIPNKEMSEKDIFELVMHKLGI